MATLDEIVVHTLKGFARISNLVEQNPYFLKQVDDTARNFICKVYQEQDEIKKYMTLYSLFKAMDK